MANATPEKTRGLNFAEQQLLRHGWKQGKGLGREENGISEAIKVKVKSDKAGIGHSQGEQFTFHWWDHVFNKASASLTVESVQDGVLVKKAVDHKGEDGVISNKKPRKAEIGKAKLYGCFVKSATLLSGQELPERKPSSTDDSSSSDDDDKRLDMSSTTKLTDSDLVKACGGRTAHKGARHGLTMSAKLARLEQQEREFMAKYTKKSKPAATPSDGTTPQPVAREEESILETALLKNSKKKNCLKDPQEGRSNESNVRPKKKKKRNRSKNVAAAVEDDPTSAVCPAWKKHSKKDSGLGKEDVCLVVGDTRKVVSVPNESKGRDGWEQYVECATEHQTTMEATIKKKRKPKKRKDDASQPSNGKETNQLETLVQDSVPQKKRRVALDVERGKQEIVNEEPKMKNNPTKCMNNSEIVQDGLHDESTSRKKKKTKRKYIEENVF